MVPVSGPVLVMPVEVVGSVASMGTEVTLDKAKDTSSSVASIYMKVIVDKASVDVEKARIGPVVKATIGPVASMDMKVIVDKASMDVGKAKTGPMGHDHNTVIVRNLKKPFHQPTRCGKWMSTAGT